MSNLKPCPFCGGVAKMSNPDYELYSPHWCKCLQCGAEGPTEPSELEAEKGWNERTQEDKWISVKDRLPEEHPSLFARFYGTERWRSAMWRNESDRVLVTIRFPDGTRTVDKGKLQDGIWKTGVSPVLPQEVTHWAVWPEPPKGEKPDD